MITFHKTTIEEVMTLGDFEELFKKMRINGMEVVDIISHLQRIPLMKACDYDGSFLGMLSVESSEAFEVEVHAYVLPEHRKRSKELLGAFKEALFTMTPFTSIKTSVTGDFKPLVRFLGFIGFEVVGVDRGVINKGSQTYDMFYLKTYKESNYG